jgi:hypothetical protein
LPGLRKAEIASRIRGALVASGGIVSTGAFIGAGGGLPWECQCHFADGSVREYLMYFWTISHGGRNRRESEYRVQAKLKYERSLEFHKGTTLLMGYYSGSLDRAGTVANNVLIPEMEAYAAWDPLAHMEVGSSSSCQLPYSLLCDAYLKGAASVWRRSREGNSERVIAFRPDCLGRYVRAAAGGHNAVAISALVS